MSDQVPAYVVANLLVEDSQMYHKYEKDFFPILKNHGGELLTFDDSPESFEGSAPVSGRLVILKFPSATAAQRWWNDDVYQQLSEYRREATDTRFLTLVHGLPPRG